MGVLDELLGNGGGALGKGKAGHVAKERRKHAPYIHAVVGIEALVLNGDKRLFDVVGNVRRVRLRGDGQLLSFPVIEVDIRRLGQKFGIIELCARRHAEIIEEERCGDDREDPEYDADDGESTFHRSQYVLCAEIFTRSARFC